MLVFPRSRLKTTTIFTYSIIITGLAFVLDNAFDLLVLTLPPIILSFKKAGTKIAWLMLGYMFGLIGVLVNSLFFANTGEPVIMIFFIEVKEGAILAFTTLSLRLLAIASAGALFVFSRTSTEIYRDILHEMGLPTIIALPIAYSLRLLPVVKKNFLEVVFQRKQRGYRTILLYPVHLSSVLRSLLAINYERAVWSGISAELRGLGRLKPRFRYKPGPLDILMFSSLILQVLIISISH